MVMMKLKPQTANTTNSTSAVGDSSFQGVDALGFVFSASHVYLLAHRTANLVKIGKANSIISRASSLCLDDFDLSKSIGLKVKTEREAFELERMLHTVFKSYRLQVEQVSSILNHSSGMTEWFSSDCMGRAQEFLSHINDMVPFERVEVTIPAKPEPSKRVNLTQQDRDDQWLKAMKKANQINEECRMECAESFKRLSSLVTFQGVSITSPNSFEVHFTSGSGRAAGIELQRFHAHGSYHRPSGFTSMVSHYSASYPRDGSMGGGRFKVLRPYSKTIEGSDGEAIESLFSEVLEALRSIPVMPNHNQAAPAGQLFCITH